MCVFGCVTNIVLVWFFELCIMLLNIIVLMCSWFVNNMCGVLLLCVSNIDCGCVCCCVHTLLNVCVGCCGWWCHPFNVSGVGVCCMLCWLFDCVNIVYI